jgi:hypothetical protein
MTDLAHRVLEPYAKNSNTGNQYEFACASYILRKMGMPDAVLNSPLIEEIISKNNGSRKRDAIEKTVAKTLKEPVGDKFTLDGHIIVDIRNVTQGDDDGKTGDLILITDTGVELSLSICGGNATRNGKIEKCLTNPTCRRLKATEEDIERFNACAGEALVAHKAQYTEDYGADESLWPGGKTHEGKKAVHAKGACSRVAQWMAERFATLTNDTQIAIFKDLLRIDMESAKPADFLALVHRTTLKISFYKFGTARFTSWTPTIVADGVWLNLLNDGQKIGKIQVKYNNGIYHRGKTSSICDSWNATFNLRDVFSLTAAPTG